MSTDNDDFKGYRSPTLDLLQSQGAPVWSVATLHTTRGDFSGLMLPRSVTSDAEHIVLKLDSGYNIGVRHDKVSMITVLPQGSALPDPGRAFPHDPKQAARDAAGHRRHHRAGSTTARAP
jgi:hypothetical protein